MFFVESTYDLYCNENSPEIWLRVVYDGDYAPQDLKTTALIDGGHWWEGGR